MKQTSKNLDSILHYLTRMKRYKSLIESSKDNEERAEYRMLYKEDSKCYLYLHKGMFGE